MGKNTLATLVFVGFHGLNIAHSLMVLHNTQSRLKCPNLEDSGMHFTFPQDFYSLAVLALTNVELAINLSITIHLFKHDQSMKGLLPNAVVKRRFRRNAVSFVGKAAFIGPFHMASSLAKQLCLNLNYVQQAKIIASQRTFGSPGAELQLWILAKLILVFLNTLISKTQEHMFVLHVFFQFHFIE